MSRLIFVFSFACLLAFFGSSTLLPAKGKKTNGVTCTVDVLNEFRAQDGTLLRSEIYQQTFPLTSNATSFVDDYSTPTRFKEFSASLSEVGGVTEVSIAWFADVSTFDSVDLNTTINLPAKQNSISSQSSQTYSSSPGHSRTSYSVTITRN